MAICSSADGRFIPGPTVYDTLMDQNDNIIGTQWQVPDEGSRTLWIRVDVPDFPRHDKTNGKRFSQPVEVKFPNIRLKVGKK